MPTSSLPIAGFAHTAFTFGAESSILNSGLPGADVPVGTLVSILQKGFQFAELEANLTEESTDVFGEFTPLSAEAIMTGDVEELRATVREWHEKRDAAALDVLASGPEELDPGACLGLGGAEGPVYACPWAPAGPPRLAAGFADGSLRLWDFPEGTREPPPAPCVCATGGEITAIEWSPGSSLLAVALMDGSIQIWEADGAFVLFSVGLPRLPRSQGWWLDPLVVPCVEGTRQAPRALLPSEWHPTCPIVGMLTSP